MIQIREVLNDIPHVILQLFVYSTPDRLRKLMKGRDAYVEKYDCLVSFAHLKLFLCEIKFSIQY